MAVANYNLTLGALIDTIFVFEIGGQYLDPTQLQGTANNVFFTDAGIRIRLELGGIERQEWRLEVEVIDDAGTKRKTIPTTIDGRIGRGGGSWFDRTCPLI